MLSETWWSCGSACMRFIKLFFMLFRRFNDVHVNGQSTIEISSLQALQTSSMPRFLYERKSKNFILIRDWTNNFNMRVCYFTDIVNIVKSGFFFFKNCLYLAYCHSHLIFQLFSEDEFVLKSLSTSLQSNDVQLSPILWQEMLTTIDTLFVNHICEPLPEKL